MSLDVNINPRKLLLRITHPLKTILVQGQLRLGVTVATDDELLKLGQFLIVFLQGQIVQKKNIKSGKLELMIDGAHFYISVRK